MLLQSIIDWLDEYEAALSALAALAVLAGLVLAPLRFLAVRRRSAAAVAVPDVSAPEAQAAPAPRVRRTVFVAPFACVGDEDRIGVLALGLGTELGNALALTSGTRVVLTEAGADYIVSGSVLDTGDDIRVLARLVNREGEQLWSHGYDSPLAGFLGTQRDLCAAIVTELGGEFMSREFERMQISTTQNMDAWAHTVHSAHMVIQRGGGPTVWDEAIEEARKAVALDPGYAAAHARLAALHGERVVCFVSRDVPADIEAARGSAERGMALAAHDPYVLMNCGQGWNHAGQPQRAREVLERAHRALPHDLLCSFFRWSNLAITGSEAEMRAATTEIAGEIERYPTHPLHPALYGVAGLLALQLGDATAACSSLRHTYETWPGVAYYSVAYAAALANLGDSDAAQRVMDDLTARGFDVSPTYLDALREATGGTGAVEIFAAAFDRAAGSA